MTKRLIDYAEKHASVCFENDAISPILYKEYGVNTGLRDEKGTGVLTGLTRVSDIVSSKIIDGRTPFCTGFTVVISNGVRPIIERASSPTATTSLVPSFTATMDGALMTTSFFPTLTSTVAVPKSMAIFCLKKLTLEPSREIFYERCYHITSFRAEQEVSKDISRTLYAVANLMMGKIERMSPN